MFIEFSNNFLKELEHIAFSSKNWQQKQEIKTANYSPTFYFNPVITHQERFVNAKKQSV